MLHHLLAALLVAIVFIKNYAILSIYNETFKSYFFTTIFAHKFFIKKKWKNFLIT